MIKIAPSILSANLLKIENEVKIVDQAGADYIHVDIMDGLYVPNITFGTNILKSLKSITKKPLDVHLMINTVNENYQNFIDAGANIISFHAETEKDPKNIINKIKNLGCKCGLAVHPNIDIKNIEKYLSIIDTVIVMTVIPGFGGQEFLQDQLSKITKLNKLRKDNDLKFKIEIDGGINKDTSKLCVEQGADILVAGSYIYNKPESQYKNLIDSLR